MMTPAIHRWLFVLPLLAVTPAAWGQTAVPTFTAHTADGAPRTGRLERLGDGWSVRLGGDPASVAAGDLLSLRRIGQPLPALPLDKQYAILATGDRVPGDVTGMSGDNIVFRLAASLGAEKEVRLPLSAVSVLWFNAPDDEEAPARLLRRLVAAQRTRDSVLLRNGDVVEGILTGVGAKALEMEVNRKTVSLDRAKVAAVALSSEASGARRPRAAHARLVLSGGGRLTLTSASCTDGKTLTGTTAFGAEVRVPLTEIAALDVQGGKAVYLSDLKPRRYDFTPALDVRWPYVADGSVAGNDLRVAGGSHDKGLGMHSESRLTYDLGGSYRRFEALVGLDERTGRGGSVRVKVLVDGKPRDLGGDRELTLRTGPLAVRVDVSGARELTLVVEFGKRLDVEDHVNWADARLVK